MNEMFIEEILDFDQILTAQKLDRETLFGCLPADTDLMMLSAEEWMEYLVKKVADMSKSVEAMKALIPSLVKMTKGELPPTVTKVTRETAKVDMTMLMVCHPEIVERLAKEGKVSISAKYLEGLGVDECITHTESTFYTLKRD